MHDIVAGARQQTGHHLGHHCIVLHQQQPARRARGAWRSRRFLRRKRRLGQRRLDAENGSLSRLAQHGDAAAHRGRQLAANGQAQATAALAARLSDPALLKATEQAALLLFAQTRAYSVEKLAFWPAAGSGGSAGSMII
jgi:hypothetical protein